MNPNQTPDSESHEDLATAYHEAGHAVVALSLGRSVLKLSIVRNSLRLGAVSMGTGRIGRRQDHFEAEALILLAGVVSESRVTGSFNWNGARQDLSSLRRLIATRIDNERAADRLERRLLDKTEHHLSQPGIWEAVKKIAGLLIQQRSISGRAARHIYDEAVRQAS